MTQQVEGILGRLDALRLNWWLFSTMFNIVLAAAFAGAVLAVLVFVDAILQLPVGALRAGFVIWSAASLGVLTAFLTRALVRQRSIAATARCIEMTTPELGNDLINLVQLSDANAGNDGFRQAALQEMAARVGDASFESAARKHSRWWRWRLRIQTPRDFVEGAAVLALVIGAFWLLSVTAPRWASSTERILKSWHESTQTSLERLDDERRS